MKVIHFVSKEDNIICIIQVSEVIIAQWKTSSGGDTLQYPINCATEQSRSENTALSDTGGGEETGGESSTDPDTRCGAVMQVFN